jgi:hypothetical protein
VRTEGRRASLSRSEQRIVTLVEDYLDALPGGGATLKAVINYVVLDTDYDSEIVKSVIERHFITTGTVVTNQRTVEIETRAMDAVVDWMEETLQSRGYTDLREEYELTGVADLDEEAALVAFDGEAPLVLCYPVDEGEVENPAYHEAAKFQAGVIAPGKVASIAWISDGHASYVFDVLLDKVIPKLPRRDELQEEPGSAPAAGGRPASERERHPKVKGGTEPA